MSRICLTPEAGAPCSTAESVEGWCGQDRLHGDLRKVEGITGLLTPKRVSVRPQAPAWRGTVRSFQFLRRGGGGREGWRGEWCVGRYMGE